MKNRLFLLFVIITMFISGCSWNVSPIATMTPLGTRSQETKKAEVLPTQINHDLYSTATAFPTKTLSPSPITQSTASPEMHVIQHQDFVEMQLIVFYEPLNQDKAFLDFDAGTIAFQEESGSDSVLSVSAGSMVFWSIRSLNGAKSSPLGEYDFSEVTFGKGECLNDKIQYGTGGEPIGDNLFFCWLTSEGQYVELAIKEMTNLDNNQRAAFVIYYSILKK